MSEGNPNAKDPRVNNLILSGRVASEPEMRTVGESEVTKFRIGFADRRKVNGEMKDVLNYMDVKVWGKQAEIVNKSIEKGDIVVVQGRLCEEQWNSKDGTPQSKSVITAHRVDTVRWKNKPEPAKPAAAQDRIAPEEESHDDIPF